MNTTMQSFRLRAGGPLLFAALIACSSSSSSPTGGDGGQTSKDGGSVKGDGGAKLDAPTHTDSPGDPVTTFCTSLLTAEAKVASQCVGGAETLWAAQLGNASVCSEISAAVAAGRATFDSTQAASCLSAVAAVNCATFATGGTEPAACSGALKGTVAGGGTCNSTLDCASPDVCVGVGVNGSCSGTCKAPIAADATCGTPTPCVAGYECTGTPATCTAIPPAATAGQPCLYDSATMMAAPGCQAGLACDLTTFECVTPVVEGKTCETGHGTCVAFTYCDPTSKTCKQDPAAGGRCGTVKGQDAIGCLGQTYCKTIGDGSTAGTCVALIASGSECQYGVECASGQCNRTDAGTGTCGASCTKE